MNISIVLHEHKNHPILHVEVRDMVSKFAKYFHPLPLLFSFSIIIDPRCKLQGLRALIEILSEHIEFDYTNSIEEARTSMFDVYRYYELRYRPPPAPSSRELAISPTSTSLSWRLMNRRVGANTSATESSSSAFNELVAFLKTTFTDVNFELTSSFDLLAWWEQHAAQFPILSKLARDILTIPVSTVSSESAFSTTARILEDRRSSLTSMMVEVITLTKDRENARLAMQNCWFMLQLIRIKTESKLYTMQFKT